jgi:hypothetical protein
MRKLYTFSPITTKVQFDEALVYVIRRCGDLSEELTGTRLTLSTAKIFAHYPEEFELMKKLIVEYGEPSNIGRSTSLYVSSSLDIEGSHLVNIGIRIPDPYRMQVGCGDFDVANPQKFVASLPKNEYGFIRPFPDMADKFIELWHPDYDIAGYIDVLA